MTTYCLTVDSGPRTIPNKAIEYVLNANDWLRLLNGRMYFLTTDEDVQTLAQRIQSVLHDEDGYFLTELSDDISFIGALPMEAWLWLKKYNPRVLSAPIPRLPSPTP